MGTVITILVGIADIAGVLVGLLLFVQGFMFLTGNYCQHCMGIIPWWQALAHTLVGILFLVPNSLFKLFCRRLSVRIRLIVATVRALATVILVGSFAIYCVMNGLPLWILLIAIGRPVSAFATAVTEERSQRKPGSEPDVGR